MQFLLHYNGEVSNNLSIKPEKILVWTSTASLSENSESHLLLEVELAATGTKVGWVVVAWQS